MSDLVKRLKARYHIHNGEPDKDCHEAAAEIERLTTALSTAEETGRRKVIEEVLTEIDGVMDAVAVRSRIRALMEPAPEKSK